MVSKYYLIGLFIRATYIFVFVIYHNRKSITARGSRLHYKEFNVVISKLLLIENEKYIMFYTHPVKFIFVMYVRVFYLRTFRVKS